MPENPSIDIQSLSASTKSVDEVLEALGTRQTGLTDEEVAQKLIQYGENKLSAKKKISPLGLYLSQFKNTLTLILIAAAVLVGFVYFFGSHDPSDLIETGLILVIVFLITIVGFAQEYKAEKAIESLKKLLAYKARVLRNNHSFDIDVIHLVPGDIVFLEEGTRIPADIRLLSVSSLAVNEASLTGESTPARKTIEKLAEEKGINDQTNMVFTGTTVSSGRGIGVVVRTGDKTEIGKIAKDVSETLDEKTPIQKRLDEIGRTIGYIIIGVCVIVFIFIIFFAQEFATQPLFERILHAFIAAVALAVAAIPEGLPAVVTIALALGTQRMLKRNVLVRKLNAVETLGATDIICSDKTGTLTKGEMTVTKISFDGKIYDVSGTGYETKGTFLLNGHEVNPQQLSLLLISGYVCNNALLDESEKVSGDPTEGALLVSAKKAGVSVEGERVFEIPFSSERKRMSVVVRNGDSYTVFVKGAPEVLLGYCEKIYKENKDLPIREEDKTQLLSTTHEFSMLALRNLGFAYKTITQEEFEQGKQNESYFEKGLTFLGIQGMIDPPRNEVKPLIEQCKASGIRVIMITGDHVDTAKAVGKEIGIEGEALTGEELDKMSEEEFDEAVERVSVYARVNPSSKMRIVDALKRNKHVVAMTGDGVNDAPALKKADIGIAMGITGTDVAKEASDMILLDDQFSTIIAAIEEGRGIFHNIRKFVTYLLSCNLAEVLIIFVALIFTQKLPLTATMLLWINVVTDGLPAIALGLDPSEKGILRYKPSVFQKEVITKPLWLEMIAFSLILTGVILLIFIPNLTYGLSTAQSAAFNALVFIELVHVYMIRSAYKVSLFSNRWLFVSVAAAVVLQLLLLSIPLARSLFGLEDISVFIWVSIVIACAQLWIVFILLQKILSYVRKRQKASLVTVS